MSRIRAVLGKRAHNVELMEFGRISQNNCLPLTTLDTVRYNQTVFKEVGLSQMAIQALFEV